MTDDHLCIVCRSGYRQAAYDLFCGVDCRETHFSKLGAGDTRQTSLNLLRPFIGGTV